MGFWKWMFEGGINEIKSVCSTAPYLFIGSVVFLSIPIVIFIPVEYSIITFMYMFSASITFALSLFYQAYRDKNPKVNDVKEK